MTQLRNNLDSKSKARLGVDGISHVKQVSRDRLNEIRHQKASPSSSYLKPRQSLNNHANMSGVSKGELSVTPSRTHQSVNQTEISPINPYVKSGLFALSLLLVFMVMGFSVEAGVLPESMRKVTSIFTDLAFDSRDEVTGDGFAKNEDEDNNRTESKWLSLIKSPAAFISSLFGGEDADMASAADEPQVGLTEEELQRLLTISPDGSTANDTQTEGTTRTIVERIETQYKLSPEAVTKPELDERIRELMNRISVTPAASSNGEAMAQSNQASTNSVTLQQVKRLIELSAGDIGGDTPTFDRIHIKDGTIWEADFLRGEIRDADFVGADEGFIEKFRTEELKLSDIITDFDDPTGLLYSKEGDLYWSGNLLAGSNVGIWKKTDQTLWLEDGRIAIGSSSAGYPLDVVSKGDSGVATFRDFNSTCMINPTLSSFFCLGDSKARRDVTRLVGQEALESLSKINGVSFRWNSQENNAMRYGLVAEEVENVFPEFVLTDENDNKFVSETSFTPVLIEAIKELNLKLSDFEVKADTSGNLIKFKEGLCINETCVSENELKALLESIGIIKKNNILNPSDDSTEPVNDSADNTDPAPEPVEQISTTTNQIASSTAANSGDSAGEDVEELIAPNTSQAENDKTLQTASTTAQ